MSTAGSRQRVLDAFAHRAPDRTPLFETFWTHHPVHWSVCGRTPATDDEMAWYTAEPLRDRSACFLRNHGTLAVGPTVEHAYNAACVTEIFRPAKSRLATFRE